MRKTLKWIGFVIGSLAIVIVLAFAAVYLLSENRLNASFDVPAEALNPEVNAEAVAAGEHIALIRGCLDCHGPDLGGAPVVEDPMIGSIYAVNLTGGAGGVGSNYTDADFERAIRHGVQPDGSPLLVMPSVEYAQLSDADVGALIAYIRSVPDVDHSVPPIQLTPLARLLFMIGQLPPLAAEVIDHTAAHPPAPQPAADAAFGEYLAVSCTGCHGLDFSGGVVPGAAPGSPKAANLTPAGELGGWDEAGFIQTLTTGMTPEGKILDPSAMPWPMTAQMSDLELKAIWAFLQTVPPIQ
jgi:mono/diheme cytochrome c family protein